MKSPILMAGALVAALALPATASAAGTIGAGPVKVAGGYTVSLHAVDAAKDTLTIMIDRGTASRGQADILSVTRGVRVTVKGASASIRGTLGRRGSVDLRLRGARTQRGEKPPKGCTGSTGTTRSGTLEGRLRVRLPNGRFATIRSFPATTYVGGTLRCENRSSGTGDGGDGDGSGDGGEPRLMLSTPVSGATVSFIATKRSLELTRIEGPTKDRGATVSAIATVRASGTNLLTVADGGARASVSSAGAFTGSGAFTATVNAGSFASGPLTGSLQVRVQGAPVIDIVGENATLLDGDKG